MYACTYADIRLVESIATDQNINLRDKNGKNALFYVLSDKGDNPDVIAALIEHEINVNCVGKVNIGDKITQLVILPICMFELDETNNLEDLKNGDRLNDGFGSSGK